MKDIVTAHPGIPVLHIRFRGELEGSATGGAGQVENPLDIVLTFRVLRGLGRFNPQMLENESFEGGFARTGVRGADTEVAGLRLAGLPGDHKGGKPGTPVGKRNQLWKPGLTERGMFAG